MVLSSGGILLGLGFQMRGDSLPPTDAAQLLHAANR